MHKEDIHLYPGFAYAEKLRVTNLHAPFTEGHIPGSNKATQLQTLFDYLPWLSDYYPNRVISDLQVFDVVDYFSGEPFINVFLFKKYCVMFRYNTVQPFGYVDYNNEPLGFSIGWDFNGATPEENILRKYKTLLNFKEALDFFELKAGDVLNNGLHFDVDEIGTFRYLSKRNELAENGRSPDLNVVFDELYEWIEEKVNDRIAYTKKHNCNTITLSGYCIESLPEEIGDCTSLQFINLDNNRLTDLPDSIKQLTNLKYIDLSDNLISEFPRQLIDLPILETLLLDLNSISIVPTSIATMECLTKLVISRNPIKNIPPKIMEGMGSTVQIKNFLLSV